MKIKSNHNFELFCKDFKVKAGGDENTITVEGYANTTTKDRQGDVILEEAWTKGGLDNYLKNPIVLAYHNPEKPIGEVTDYGVNNKGLHVTAEISKAAGDVYTLIREGVLKAFSVGFRVEDAEYDKDTDIFVIKNLEMYELSVVSIPANADSIFSVRKSFETEEDYIQFKKNYTTQASKPDNTLDKNLEDTQVIKPVIKEKIKVDKEDTLSITPEDLAEIKAKAVKDAMDEIEAKKAKAAEISEIVAQAGQEGVERLTADFEAKMAEKDATVNSTLEEFRAELQEKNAELAALTKNKMSFENHESAAKIKQDDIDTAVLTAKIMGTDLDKTKYFQDMVTKANIGDHLASVTAEWENLFSTRLYEDIKDKTIIEPLFTNHVNMTSRTMTFPWNPEAGYAQWIADTAYKADATSTGTAAEQLIQDNTIKAEKLASKEYLGYEEEEDAIIAIAPIIRAAVLRRMVRSTDTELLRANAGADTGSGNAPTGFNGVTTLAADINAGADYQYTQPGTFGDPATIADLQQVRRKMGTPGLHPGNVVYVVSEGVYFDLLEDPDFRTMDVIGEKATILTGQVGMVNGSPVLVSDGFVADATATVQAMCFNNTNYMFGELRGLMVERDKDIEFQRHVLVATRRFGLTEIVPAVAVATKRQSFCANLVRP
jgi:HK97 family phage prohead protease